MKKKLFTILLIIIISKNFYGNDLKMNYIDETTLQKVIELNVNKQEIFEKLEEWIKNNFNDPIDNIEEKNKDENLIKGIGNFILIFNQKITFNYYFNYKFEIKDKKIRFTITNIFTITAYREYTGDKYVDTGMVQKNYISGKYLQNIITMIENKKILYNLQNTLNGTQKKDNNW